MDETLYPLDHKTAGHIVDNDLHRIMVGPLPQGCRLTAIFDCVRLLPPACSASLALIPLGLAHYSATLARRSTCRTCTRPRASSRSQSAFPFSSFSRPFNPQLTLPGTACSPTPVQVRSVPQRRTSAATSAASSRP